jgi:hypothetical protein
MGWSRQFDEPIPLPKGKPLVTLRDAALYITKLPKAEHNAAEWQAAMQALLLVAEHNGPTMFARIGVMRALNRHVERVFNSSRKKTHWGTRNLARDRKVTKRVRSTPSKWVETQLEFAKWRRIQRRMQPTHLIFLDEPLRRIGH